MTETFTDNAPARRYELQVGSETAYATYRLQDKTLYIDYVEAPHALRGTGAAGRLMEHIVAQAQANGLKITPVCGYAAAWLRRNPG